MLEYQRKLYAAYHTTHVSYRKGADTPATLATRGRIWDKTWGPLLPLDHDARILDCACGNGAMVAWLRDRGYGHAEGIDISPEVIEQGNRLGIEGLSVGDFRDELLRRASTLDVVILRDVLEHFPKEDTMDVLAMGLAALKSDGRLILHVPNAESPLVGRVRYGDFTHETAFTPSSLAQLLLASGYDVPHFLPSPPVATSWLSALRVRLFTVVQMWYKLLAWSETGAWPNAVTQNMLCVARPMRD